MSVANERDLNGRPPYHLERGTHTRRTKVAVVSGLLLYCFVFGAMFALLAPYLMVMFAVPYGLAGLAVIWALPSTRRPPVNAMEWLFFGYFIALFIWPDYLSIALPGLPWISLIRLIVFPMCALFLISLSSSREFRNILRDILRRGAAIPWIVAGFVGLQVLSTAFSHAIADSVQKLVIDQMNWSLIFVVSCYVFSKPGRATRWAHILWWLVAAIGCMAAVEVHFGRVLWAGHVPGFLRVEDPSVAATLAGGRRAYTNVYRAQATFSVSLGLAEFMAMAFPFIMHFALMGRRRAERVLAIVTLPFIVLVVYFTDSRSGFLGVLVGAMTYGLIWAVRRWRSDPKDLLAPAIALSYPVLGSGVLAATVFVGRLHRAVWGGGATAASTAARAAQLQMGVPLVLHRPWGYGIGQGAEALGFRLPDGTLTIDSYYLLVALEYGLVGLGLILALLGTAVTQAASASMRTDENDDEQTLLMAAAAALCVFGVIKMVYAQQDSHPFVFMILGLIVALLGRLRGRSQRQEEEGALANAKSIQ